jgi:hypothetical protein
VKPLQEIRDAWQGFSTFPAVALRGEGVIETYRELMRVLYRSLDEKHDFATKFGLSEEDFLKSLLRNFASPRGTGSGTA